MENKNSIVGIIAIILGAAGLGIGTFSVINFQIVESPEGPEGPPGQDGLDGTDGINGTDGQDAPGYFCTSGVEVQNAIDAIGSGSGTIIITDDITLSTTIIVDQGGDYIIQGNGAITIDCGGDRTAFDITNVKTCTIRDLKINGSEIVGTTKLIFINDTNDNPIYIQNVQIIGRRVHNPEGIGIMVNSDNVWIQHCFFTYLSQGIQLENNSESCHILDNSIESISFIGIWLGNSNYNTLSCNVIDGVFADSGNVRGICLGNSNYNILSCNVIDNVTSYSGGQAEGIRLSDANNNTLIGNIINDVYADSSAFGIILGSSDFNTLSGNGVNDVYSNSSFACGIRVDTSYLNTLSGNAVNKVYAGSIYACGIEISWDCEYITLSGNTVINVYCDASEGYGMTIYMSKYNTLSGNTVINVYSDVSEAYGIILWDIANNNTILGNMISHINPAGGGYGIYVTSTSDYNNVIGNIATDIKTDGIYISPSSTGNQEALNQE